MRGRQVAEYAGSSDVIHGDTGVGSGLLVEIVAGGVRMTF